MEQPTAAASRPAQRARNRVARHRLVLRIERLLEPPATYLAFVFAGAIVAELILTAQGREVPAVITWAQLGIWGFFILHFVVAFGIAPDRVRYLRRNWLTAVSLILPFLRALRVLRAVAALRALNAVRLLTGANRTIRSLQRTLAWNGAGYAAGLTGVVALVGSTALFMFESASPGTPIDSYGQSLWWTLATLTTVGAQFEPVTLGGRMTALVVMVAGLVLLGYVAGLLGSVLFGRRASGPRAGGYDPRVTQRRAR